MCLCYAKFHYFIGKMNSIEVLLPKPGECCIKAQFLDTSLKRKNVSEEVPSNSEEIAEKTVKVNDGVKIKPRGQNKARPKTFRDKTNLACTSIINVKPGEEPKSCEYPNCAYIHDPLVCLKSKPADLGSECYVFNINGFCPRGINCRFGSKHITEDGKNIHNIEKCNVFQETTINSLKSDVYLKLIKKKYDFKIAESIAKELENKKDENKKDENEKDENKKDENKKDDLIKPELDKPNGCVVEEVKKIIDWRDKLYLAPLTTVGNLPFRRICKEFGADITCGEMALCDSLLKGHKQEWALLKRHKSEDLFGVQICGFNKYTIAKVAQLIENETDVDFVDLNLGCPIDLIYKKGGGSGMLHRLPALEVSIRAAAKILTVPFTCKTRTGVYQNTKLAHKLMPKFFEWGASFATIHGRSREGRYTRQADWEYIEECAKACSPYPVFGNGDILSFEDYQNRRESAPSVQGVMIGRGALIKPWIFTEIKEQRLWDIRSSERMDIIKKYVNYGLEHWGSDTQGVENTRRFLLEWLSFLYRYIPVGILEQPPQKMNERPPKYIGRDDLETLMASSNCADWIKISEMLLGPVPDGFQFLPKHKANSY